MQAFVTGNVYVNVHTAAFPGGEVRAGLAVFDTMNNCGFDITTLNLGIAASISGFLCGAGTKGQRMALPNARFLLQVLQRGCA